MASDPSTIKNVNAEDSIIAAVKALLSKSSLGSNSGRTEDL